MLDYKKIIDSIYQDILSSVNKLPYNPNNILDDFLVDFYNSIRNANVYLEEYKSKLNEIENLILDSDNKFKSNLKNINTRYTYDLEEIRFKNNNKILEINNLIKGEEINLNNKINLYKEEKNLITTKTNPEIYNHILKRNKLISEYEVYKKNIKNKYNKLVQNFTLKRDTINNEFSISCENILKRYLDANENIISLALSKIRNLNKALDHKHNELTILKNVYEKDLITIDKEFNQKVVKITNNISLALQLNENQYAMEKKDFDEKIQEIQKKALHARSNSLKNFINEIETINSKQEKRIQSCNNHIEYHNRLYSFKKFELQKSINSLIEENHFTNNKELIEKNNIKIKILEQEIKTLKKSKILYTSTYSIYNKKKNNISLKQKSIIEQIKNNDLNIIAANEELLLNEVKSKLDILEYNYKNTIDILKKESEYKIKEERNHFDERKMNITKEYKINQNLIFIEIEKLLHQKILIEDEIEFINELAIKVKQNEQVISNMDKEKNSIEKLLEIEKNNLLKKYNILNLEFLQQKEELLFNYEETNSFNNRDKKISLLDLNIKKSNIDFKHNKDIYMYEIEIENEIESYQIQLKEADNINKVTSLETNNVFDHLNAIINILINEFELNKKIILSFIDCAKKMIYSSSIQVKSNKKYEEYKHIISSIISLINKSCSQILSYAKSNVVAYLDKQITYETKDKYKVLYDNLSREFDEDMKTLYEKKFNLEDTKKNYNSAINQFITEIIMYENQTKLCEQKYKKGIITHQAYKKSVKKLNYEKEYYQKLIEKNQNYINKLDKILDSIPNKINKTQTKYNKKTKELENEKREDAYILYDVLKEIAEFFDEINMLFKINSSYALKDWSRTYFSIITTLIIRKYNNNANHIISLFNKIINSFKKESNKKNKFFAKDNAKNLRKNNLKINSTHNKTINRIKNKINNSNDKYNSYLKQNKDEFEIILNKHSKLDEANLFKYRQSLNNLKIKNDQIRNETYIKIVSTNENIYESNKSHIIKKYQKNKLSYNTNQELVSFYITRREKINISHKSKIYDIKNKIDYIPIECKNQIKESKDDLNNYKYNYHMEKKYNNLLATQFTKNINRITLKNNKTISKKILKFNKINTKNKRNIIINI